MVDKPKGKIALHPSAQIVDGTAQVQWVLDEFGGRLRRVVILAEVAEEGADESDEHFRLWQNGMALRDLCFFHQQLGKYIQAMISHTEEEG